MDFDVIEDIINLENFIDFLKKLRYDAESLIFVIADNVRCHHCELA